MLGGLGAPLIVPDGIDKFVAPRALENFVVHKVCFTVHAHTFHQLVRTPIARIAASIDPVQAQAVKPQGKHGARCFAGIAVSLVGRVKNKANLALLMLLTVPY